MKKWTRDTVIEAPIEEVWKLFDGSLENMQKIMTQVIEHEPIKVTEEGVGSIYLQKYQEGNRIEEYHVETLAYQDTSDYKQMKIGFSLAKLFEITADYRLEKLDEARTHFNYTATNHPLKWYVKLILLFASDKMVVQFVERVKSVAENEYQVHT
ncbi:SRPBCC family protein [Thalassobacillus sp. CUG 92003]|uniref:SRPBCC family protein n=1 Tax=Thalassobacillus sp. CUG 92003 TaxID=2736641 RepID=UPI0015E720DF|nr:SRPBCC family protein [Thalassobacillus sp. CUG 92003]